jgi:hypothetical protein
VTGEDFVADERPVANAGYAITGSGGGGSDGQYVFADLAELNAIKAEWTRLHEDVLLDKDRLTQALRFIEPPAQDEMSRKQAQALADSLTLARRHNEAMADYASAYIDKLNAAHQQYATEDEAAMRRVRRTDET